MKIKFSPAVSLSIASHTVGQGSYPAVDGQHNINSVVFLTFFGFILCLSIQYFIFLIFLLINYRNSFLESLFWSHCHYVPTLGTFWTGQYIQVSTGFLDLTSAGASRWYFSTRVFININSKKRNDSRKTFFKFSLFWPEDITHK